jgi:hypothetical protein
MMNPVLVRALLLFALTLGISHGATAQFDFQSGSFRLKSSPEIQREGFLREGSGNLVVKQTMKGPTVKYPWEEVLSYRLGMSRYIRMSGFLIKSPSGWGEQIADNAFVQLLDSGTVSLMRYENKSMGNQLQPPAIYLLKRTSEKDATAIPYRVLDGAGKPFWEALAPYVTERPDLVSVLNSKKVTVFSLQAFIHAFNTRQPFLNYPMSGATPGSQ